MNEASGSQVTHHDHNLCPVCHERRQEMMDGILDQLCCSYGEIVFKDYLKIANWYFNHIKDKEIHTLVEDYSHEILSCGNLEIVYRCKCTSCGFEKKHEIRTEL